MAHKRKKAMKLVSGLVGVSGLILIIVVLSPIVLYETKARREYPDLIRPLVGKSGISAVTSKSSPEVLSESDIQVDYTDAKNWFPKQGANFASNEEISFYTLSIPELRIENAAVAIGGEDLSNNLIQYPGTALPGKVGNAVVFGHSILPVFYDPKNYLAIFSTIDKLKTGNEILVDYDGITYTYRVREKFEVKPTDVYILNQNEPAPYLSLVTCSPMGHPAKPKRFVVRAELVSNI